MMPVETKTKIHEDSKKLVYQDSDVKKAMDLIRDRGYVMHVLSVGSSMHNHLAESVQGRILQSVPLFLSGN